ncbi:MAG TPA: MFS transporter [Cytophagales bacterium]|nr:MFS transporter [Cytophagales bacterium]HAA21176.1 MFS transporter [Cytophagales bacterium]HAP60696.1 MFS transporter [Cytophagales bacterium]
MEKSLNQPKVLNAWCMYDWANSVYALVIKSTIFPIYYANVTSGYHGSDMIPFLGFTIKNTVLYSWSWAFSFLVVALIIPLLSGIADYRGTKKRFMEAFTLLGGISCIALFFFDGSNVEYGIFMSVLASIGYTGSLVFYNAFLPEIATEDKYDMLSAKGFSLGYVGSLILLILNLALLTTPETFGITKGLASKLAFLMVGVWWIGFAQLSFRRLPKGSPVGGTLRENMTKGYRELLGVYRNLRHLPYMRYFLLSFFLYSMGIQTTMYMATIFGKTEIHMEDNNLIVTILILQAVAIAGSYLFAWMSGRRGNKPALYVQLIIWIGICFSATFLVYTSNDFYFLAVTVGLVMGGLQSLSRSSFSKLIPENTDDYASYFSFYDVSEKIATVVGTFSYGLIEQLTGSMRNSAMVLGVYFVLGMFFLIRVKFPRVRQALTTS